MVEVMLGCVLLLLLVMACGAYLYHSRATIGIQRNRRAALEKANGRIESLRVSGYDAIKPAAKDYVLRYLRASGSNWVQSLLDPGEVALLNGRSYPMRTTVRYADADGGTPSYDCLQVRVEVDGRAGSGDRIALETLYAP